MFSEKFFKEKVPIFGGLIGWMSSNGMDYGPLAAGVSFLLLLFSLFVFGVSSGEVFSFFFALAPLWLPVVLFLLFFEKWTEVIGLKFYLNEGRSTLRLKLPAEVTKSPEAMEFVISQIHNTASADNLMQTYLAGKRPLPLSLEIVSIGGEVRFYVNTKTKQTRNALEANLYAQYPGIEVVEESVDYAAEIPIDYEKDYDIMAFHMGKKRDQEFPIKTYLDFGLDKFPKEEEKVDPITPMLEILSTIKPYERLFIQFICIPYRPDSFGNGQLQISESPSWTEGVKKKISEIMNRDPETKKPLGARDLDEGGQMAMLTSGERDTIAAMERISSKYAYKTGIRWMYITKKGKFNGDIISPMIRSFSQYDMIGRNEIGARWRTDFDYKDIIPGGKKKAIDALKKQELKEYRMRVYFPKAQSDEPKIFTSEELATVFHLPGQVAATPTLERVTSTRAEAPSNLPIGDLPTSQ